MRPYHPANLALQPYRTGRVKFLAWFAKFLGVQFHIAGIPFGAARASQLQRSPGTGELVGFLPQGGEEYFGMRQGVAGPTFGSMSASGQNVSNIR